MNWSPEIAGSNIVFYFARKRAPTPQLASPSTRITGGQATFAAKFLTDIGDGIWLSYLELVRKELVFEAGHFTCSPFFRTSPNNYGFCLLCLLSAQKNHIFERELAQLDFFYDF